MAHEVVGFSPEVARSVQTEKSEFAKRLLDNSLAGADFHQSGERGSEYRYFQTEIDVPGLGQVIFCLDIKSIFPTDGEEPFLDRLKFSFRLPTEDGSEQERVAAMDFSVVNPREYHLTHRYVIPRLRAQSGVGTQLYHEAESWLQQIAKELHHPVPIHLQAGQRSVMRWAQKVGFQVKDSQRRLLAVIEDPHQEEFIEREGIEEGRPHTHLMKRDPYIFRVKETGSDIREHAERLDFMKILLPGA